MPLASMSKVTSTCGTPRGAGAMPVSSKVPSGLLSRVNSRSPWKTWIATDGWLSSAVVKVSLRLVGMAVLRSMSFVIEPPLVSMPRRERRDVDEQDVLALALQHAGLQGGADGDDLVRVDALVGRLATGQRLDDLGTAGMRVEPPTRTTCAMSLTDTPASLMTSLKGFLVRSSRSEVICSNCAREMVSSRLRGPSAVSVRYGSWMLALVWLDSSFLACSAASFRRCLAILSVDRSTPCSSLNFLIRWSTMRWSQSSPPRRLSPEVARTWIVEKSSSLPTSSRRRRTCRHRGRRPG